MKKYLITFSFLVFASLAFSQEVVEQPRPSTVGSLEQAEQLPTEGTYQIIVQGKDVIPAIPQEIMYQINHKRAYEEVTYLIVNDYVKIKILPFKVIRAKDFTPLKTYYHEN